MKNNIIVFGYIMIYEYIYKYYRTFKIQWILILYYFRPCVKTNSLYILRYILRYYILRYL